MNCCLMSTRLLQSCCACMRRGCSELRCTFSCHNPQQLLWPSSVSHGALWQKHSATMPASDHHSVAVIVTLQRVLTFNAWMLTLFVSAGRALRRLSSACWLLRLQLSRPRMLWWARQMWPSWSASAPLPPVLRLSRPTRTWTLPGN